MGIAAAIVAGGVLISRLLGLVRQIVFAWLLGAGAAGDEYFVAFLIPDLLNYLLAGAYMAITLIPLLTRRFAAGDEADALAPSGRWLAHSRSGSHRWRSWRCHSSNRCCAWWNRDSPTIRWPRRHGSPGSSSLRRSSSCSVNCSPHGSSPAKFVIPTLGPIVYNLAIIAGGLIGGLGRDNPSADGFAWGALAGAVIGIFGLQVWGAWREGLRFPGERIRRHPAVRRYFALAIPLMLGQSLVVFDEQLGRTFGSLHADGGVSWLTFGRQTMLVPVGVVAQAAGVAAYPFLARLAAEGKHVELAQAVGRALRYVLVFSLAAAAALIALSEPVVRLLYERGSFGAADTTAVAGTVVFFAIGVPMWGIQQILARGFYAREEMWAPVVVGTLATVAAIPIYWVLDNALGVDGLALASTVAITLYTAVLAVMWYRRTGASCTQPVMRTGIRVVPLAVVGGLAAFALGTWIGDETAAGWVSDAIAVGLAGAVAMAITLGPPWVRRDLRRG